MMISFNDVVGILTVSTAIGMTCIMAIIFAIKRALGERQQRIIAMRHMT